MEIKTWLRRLGLGQHESLFIANAIDCDVLPQLTQVSQCSSPSGVMQSGPSPPEPSRFSFTAFKKA
ncbi:SAM domain-containing protein [Bradyrhizobium sp. GCM10028915]|uniref:SAM domain-containing protein n=1 Tax=Bradyrhizobium sp. GCM10028915 TaxID=3273385 RepID=UPI003612EEAF